MVHIYFAYILSQIKIQLCKLKTITLSKSGEQTEKISAWPNWFELRGVEGKTSETGGYKTCKGEPMQGWHVGADQFVAKFCGTEYPIAQTDIKSSVWVFAIAGMKL